MSRPVLVCAADLSHLPEVRARLDAAFTVLMVEPDAATLARALVRADAYYAALGCRLTGEMIEAAGRLKAIATPSTGLDHLDVPAARRRGIAVLSLKDERALLDRITATAELAWALALACARRLPAAFDAARRGLWARDALRGHQLAYRTFGVIGCGRLGSIVAEYARAFRMRVLGCDVRPVRLDGVEAVGLGELLERSDVVSLHIHLSDENRGFMDRRRLFSMKPGSILINTSRGAIVDEAAVLDALDTGPLGAYGTDVIDGEWRDDLHRHPLICAARASERVVITPHVGGVTLESQAMAFAHVAGMLIDYMAAIGDGG